ncbi:MAG: histidine phosphatase family protein [Desulfuromonadales bacterium]|jgi:phosphohistidine phosphatase
MKRLILVRHAKSSWANPDLKDFDRPLNSRGERDAPIMGQRLLKGGLVPQVIVTSPAKRAWTTAQLIAQEIGIGAQEIIRYPEIYEADVATLMAVIGHLAEDWKDVMLVGHNPGLSELAEYLTGKAFGNLPTCAVCSLVLPISDWHQVKKLCAEVCHLDYPKNRD